MANANRPSGLSPVMHAMGVNYTGGGRVYCIPSTDSTNAYAIGDPVASGGSADSNGIPTVTLATAGTGNAIRGVIMSAGGLVNGAFLADPTNLNTTVIPTVKTKNYYVMVIDDPRVIFEAQEDSIGQNLAATDVGLNVNLVAGTNNGYLSGWMIDSSTAGTGSTIQAKILQLAPRPGNAIGQYGKWWVLINNHELMGGVTGV